MIPAFTAVFALMFVFASPNVMADDSNYSKWDGEEHHKRMIQIGELSGSEPVTRETIHEKKGDVISLSDATKAYPDAKKASIGIAVNDNDEKFLVWKVVSVTQNDDGTRSSTIYVVDAFTGDEITTVENFDHHEKDGKWAHDGMHEKFANLSPEDRDAKFAQFKEMKTAFSSISDEDKQLIKDHFKDMRQEFANLSDEEKAAKHDEFKSHMEEFAALSLDEKIQHLQELADSLK